MSSEGREGHRLGLTAEGDEDWVGRVLYVWCEGKEGHGATGLKGRALGRGR